MMTRSFLLTLVLSLFIGAGTLFAQKYITREAMISFYGETAVETIDPVSNQGSSVIDLEKKALAYQVQMKSFRFRKALMEEHFNENYVESETYPKAVFRGQFTEDVDLNSNDEQTITVKGNMNMHGVDRDLETTCTIVVNDDGTITLTSEFQLKPKDFDIHIPSAVRNKIAETFDVKVKGTYKIVK